MKYINTSKLESKIKTVNSIGNRNKPILSITINQTTYDNLDKYCKKYHINKSSLMDKIINDFLDLNL